MPRDGARHELNAGKLITTPPPRSLHSIISVAVLNALQRYLQQHPFACAFSGAGFVLSSNPLTIRQPDVSILSKARVAATEPDSYFEGAPELAVEIVSPSDSVKDLEIKIRQYLAAGAKQVWVLYPKTQEVHVFLSSDDVFVLKAGQVLEGGDPLPAFSIRVADLFALR